MGYLQSAFARPYHFHWHADQRLRRQCGDRADAVSADGGSEEGYQSLHQFARWKRDGWDGDLRYGELPAVRCRHLLRGPGCEYGDASSGAGTKGKRYALPNSRVMMHQPTGGATGQTSDISIAAREIVRWRERMNELIASHTNKTKMKSRRIRIRDFYLTAHEAMEYGIVDKVIENKPDA